MKSPIMGLVGDIGGTNARFALIDEAGHIRFPKVYPSQEHGSLSEIIEEYLETTAGKKRPTRAVFAVAGPVVDGAIEFTNLEWQISEVDLLVAFDFETIKLINDFAAQAMAAPRLEGEQVRTIGPDLKGPVNCPCVVLGAGTGFGVGGLIRGAMGDLAIATEGGHAGFAPFDEVEAGVLRRLAAKYGRVSIERVLSGPGLYDLYLALCDIRGRAVLYEDERAMLAAGLEGEPGASETLDRFCAILGGVAGDLALTYGARGGVFVSGGIAPRLIDRIDQGGFRERFEAKGRLADYVKEIPTFLINHPYAALVGAAHELKQLERQRL